MSNPYSAYRQTQVLTATPLQLVHLAYEGAINAIREADRCIEPLQLGERQRCITKAQLIVAELKRGLDFQSGGAIAAQLNRIYDFALAELPKAVYQKESNSLRKIADLLQTLDEAWAKLARNESELPEAAAYAETAFSF